MKQNAFDNPDWQNLCLDQSDILRRVKESIKGHCVPCLNPSNCSGCPLNSVKEIIFPPTKTLLLSVAVKPADENDQRPKCLRTRTSVPDIESLLGIAKIANETYSGVVRLFHLKRNPRRKLS